MDAVDQLLTAQHGLVCRDQLIGLGVPAATIRNRVGRGTWARPVPGVYGVGVDPADPRVRIRAAWLWAGPDCVVIGRSAAFWWGLHPAPVAVELAVPRSRRMTSQRGVLVVRSDIPQSERRTRDGIIVTSIERSLLDLARTGDPDRTEDALRLRITTQDRLVASVAQSSYRRGQLAARKLVDELTDGPWSPPERRLHVALRGAKIAGWKANVGLVLGGRLVRPDVAFEELKLAVEIDGREQHSKAEVFESDRQRQNLLVLDGWTVLRFTWRQIRYQIDEVIAEIWATLAMLRARTVRAAR